LRKLEAPYEPKEIVVSASKAPFAMNQLWEVGRDGKYIRRILAVPSGYSLIGWVWQPSVRS